MNIYLSIDDTDNLDSPGSGQLAEILAGELTQDGLASHCSNITRHQLFVHDAVPYTSHNSAMCFSAVTREACLIDLIDFSRQFLKKNSATGSDPGLCVVVESDSLDRETLIDFGLRAKQDILDKQEAYFLAERVGVHLSEHGGTGDGIIGALAGTGLRMHGNDGRFRGWLDLGSSGEFTTREQLCAHPVVDDVLDQDGIPLPENARIILADSRVKTVMQDHLQVIRVTRKDTIAGNEWKTLTRKEVKHF